MANRESLESVAVVPQGEGSAELERTAVAVMWKTFGNWMLCTFVINVRSAHRLLIGRRHIAVGPLDLSDRRTPFILPLSIGLGY